MLFLESFRVFCALFDDSPARVSSPCGYVCSCCGYCLARYELFAVNGAGPNFTVEAAVTPVLVPFVSHAVQVWLVSGALSVIA